jgi:LPXTG-motif cell wall-anchored protein
VCDLSANVAVPVAQVRVDPPVPASSNEVAQLPRTGLANLQTMLALGFGAVLLGGALLLNKRRFGAR